MRPTNNMAAMLALALGGAMAGIDNPMREMQDRRYFPVATNRSAKRGSPEKGAARADTRKKNKQARKARAKNRSRK